MGKKALCVGINTFRNLPEAKLKGCVNDAKAMKALLTEYLGFTSRDIKVLTNSKATKAAIMEQLHSMVDGAIQGSYTHLVFSFSSHGTQVPDISGDEPDRVDEAFCPHDLAEDGDLWRAETIITDDELRDLFIRLPEEVLLEVYLDTCHSGTGLKALDMHNDRRARYLPPPSDAAFFRTGPRTPRGLIELFLRRGVTRHILWSGCKADQTSADTEINGTWYGAFTYYFCKKLREADNTLSRAALLDKVRAALKANHYTQIPQLETDATHRQHPPGTPG